MAQHARATVAAGLREVVLRRWKTVRAWRTGRVVARFTSSQLAAVEAAAARDRASVPDWLWSRALVSARYDKQLMPAVDVQREA